MTSAEKLYEEWLKNCPKEARFQDVKKLLDYFFLGKWRWGSKKSHIVISADVFKYLNEYGELSIAVKSGKKVKGFYIKKILQAIEFIKGEKSE